MMKALKIKTQEFCLGACSNSAQLTGRRHCFIVSYLFKKREEDLHPTNLTELLLPVMTNSAVCAAFTISMVLSLMLEEC